MSKPAFELGQRVTFTHRLWRQVAPSNRGIRKAWEPYSYAGYATTPQEGVIMGRRTLANGRLRLEEWGNELDADEYFTAYLIAYDLHRKPVYVRPEHIEATEPESDTE